MKIRYKLSLLEKDAFYKRYFIKFTKKDYDYLEQFILEIEKLSREDAIKIIGRSAMRENKPKNWTAIEELLSIAIKID